MNADYYKNQYKAELELLFFPREYTPEMAYSNNDILKDHYGRNYNTDRLLKFIDNFNNGIPDYVRITTFGIDGTEYI